MVKPKAYIIIVFLIFLFSSNISYGFSSNTFYCVQLASSKDEEELKGSIKYTKKDVKKIVKKERECPFEFDEESLRLSLEALLYSGRVKEAYKLAKLGYREFKTWYWLEQAAKTALWSGHMAEAARYYFEKYRWKHQPEDAQMVLKLSQKRVGTEYAVALYKDLIERGQASPKTYKKLAKLYQEYYPYEGFSYFKELYARHPESSEIFYALFDLAYITGNTEDLFNLFRENPQLIYQSPERALKVAMIYLNQGKSEKAYEVIKEASRYTTSENDKFLRFAVDLGWLKRDYKNVYSWLRLLRKGGQATSYDLERLLVLAINYKAEDVEELVKEAWEKEKKPVYLSYYLNYLIQTRQYKKLERWFQSLSLEERKALTSDVNFLILYATVQNILGKEEEAFRTFRYALRKYPQNPLLHENYIYFLINAKIARASEEELLWLRRHPELLSKLYYPAALLAQAIGRNDEAIRYLKKSLETTPEDMDKLLMLADLYELADQTAGAQKIRLTLYRKLRAIYEKNPEAIKDPTFLKALLRTSFYFAPPGEVKALFKKAQGLLRPEEYTELRFSYLAMRSSNLPAEYILKRYKPKAPWTHLYIALANKDADTARQLLHLFERYLPIRDRVTAAEISGNIPKAYSLAFEGLEYNRRDWPLYKQFRDLIMNWRPPIFELDNQLLGIDELSLYQTAIKTNIELGKGFFAHLGYEHIFLSSSSSDYPKTPDLDSLSLGLFLKRPKLKGFLGLGLASAHRNFPFARAEIEKDSDFLSYGLRVFWHRPGVLDNNYLLIGGYKDLVAGSLRVKLTNRMGLTLEPLYETFRGQDNTLLGTGKELTLSQDYILRSGYPDISFYNYFRTGKYHSKKTEGSILSILPTPDTKVVPDDFWEIGSVVNIGFQNRYYYNRLWRPFGSLGLFYNSLSNLGLNLSFGAGGRVFGQDLLSIILDYSQGVGPNPSSYFGFLINYKLW